MPWKLDVGFDHVVDYLQDDFTRTGERYDLILDAKTNRSPFRYLEALEPNGAYVTVGGELPRLIQLALLRPWIERVHRRRFQIVSLETNKDLSYANRLWESGILRCLIDGPYRLEEAPERLQYFGEGAHQGKVILTPWT